jgi:hypothetical protein
MLMLKIWFLKSWGNKGSYANFFIVNRTVYLFARRLRLACTILAGFARFWGLPAKASDHKRTTQTSSSSTAPYTHYPE